MVVYNITSNASFDAAKEFCDLISSVTKNEHPCMIIVGNRSDLESERKVTKDMGLELAKTWNVPFIETSAKTDNNIQQAFFELILSTKFYKLEYKVMVMGDGHDKAAICKRFVDGCFVPSHDGKEDCFRKEFSIPGVSNLPALTPAPSSPPERTWLQRFFSVFCL
eukprot:Phypoly_transcript_17606.p1 GENE.Phypoly_transcript_17606~~Phypoly_transcript_17606.p1  ORF type:complete len:165 (+),score=26.96 Phypoly_transcript_17606:220-714(+)